MVSYYLTEHIPFFLNIPFIYELLICSYIIIKEYTIYDHLFQGFSKDKTPINAIAVILKGNDVASAVKVRHFRGKQELPWITLDRKFSNFHQEPRFLSTPVTIEPVRYNSINPYPTNTESD